MDLPADQSTLSPRDINTALLDALPTLIWQAGTDGMCHYFNRTWLEFTGRTLEEELGEGWVQGVHPEDAEKTVKTYLDAFRARQPFQIEYRLRHRDGEYRDIIDHGAPVFDPDGSFAGYIGSCHDITARKYAETRLTKSEQRFAAFMDNQPAYAWMKDIEGRYVYVNQLTERMPEYQAGWQGKTDAEIWPEKIAAEYRANDEKVISSGAPIQTVEPYLIEGETRHALATKFPIFDENGAVVMVGGASVDITDRIRAEEALRESEERFRQLIRSLPSAVYTCDIEGYITLYNEAAAVLWGREPELGKDRWCGSWRIYDPDGHPIPIDECPMAVALREGRSVRGREIVIERPDGTRSLVLPYPDPLRDSTGAVVGAVNMLVDFTARKESEKSLRESEERFRQLAENIEEVFWIRNVEPWQMEYVSPAYERIWKRSIEEMRSRPYAWADSIHPEDRERVTQRAGQMQTKVEYDETYRIVWPDGSIRWIRDRAFPIRDPQGKLIRIAGIAEDITERKRTEQQVENFADMLQILTNRLFAVQEEERQHLARELHDEIGQSLTAAKMEIEAAKKVADPVLRTERLDDSLAVIEHLLKSVRSLSLDLRPALLDEVGLAAALRAHVHSSASRSGLSFHLDVDDSLPRCDSTTEIACFRVAQEALTNVLRHSRAKMVRIELHRRGDDLCLFVRDDGVGFDVAAANAGVASGVSFGLLSMRERVHLAGGRFSCNSSAGHGTEIEVHFPMKAPPMGDRHEKAANNPG